MQDVTKLIEKYGPEISRSLGIASSEAYGKLLWYVRVGGVLELLTVLSVLFLAVSGAIFAWKATEDDSHKNEFMVRFVFVCLVGLIFSLLGLVLIQVVGNPVIRIILPEYWLIDQIVKNAI